MIKNLRGVKVFIAKILANDLTGSILALLFKNRIPFYGFTINVADPVITNTTKALLFWKLYEKAEINFVNNYLSENEDVIELGSSIGVMGSIISQKQTTGRYISVEANPALININHKNIALNRKTNYVLLNKAVDYFNKTVPFSTDKNNLVGKVNRNDAKGLIVEVETITLGELCDIYNLTKFTLVSDIEGAEITILLNDENALNKCSKIIIELHNTEYMGKTYSVDDMVNLIISYNFTLMGNNEPVFAFKNKTN